MFKNLHHDTLLFMHILNRATWSKTVLNQNRPDVGYIKGREGHK